MPPACWRCIDDQQAALVVQTADILNESFVSIKVDKEERPDVDHLFMTYLQATQGGGGWWVVQPLLACCAIFRDCQCGWPTHELPISALLLNADCGVGLQADECISHSQPETFLCRHLLPTEGGCPGCSELLSTIVGVGCSLPECCAALG